MNRTTTTTLRPRGTPRAPADLTQAGDPREQGLRPPGAPQADLDGASTRSDSLRSKQPRVVRGRPRSRAATADQTCATSSPGCRPRRPEATEENRTLEADPRRALNGMPLRAARASGYAGSPTDALRHERDGQAQAVALPRVPAQGLLPQAAGRTAGSTGGAISAAPSGRNPPPRSRPWSRPRPPPRPRPTPTGRPRPPSAAELSLRQCGIARR